MATSYKEFRIELYQEHLEEASALYEQRLALVDDPEITWLDIGEFEERLEAHIDALVVGAELALDVCKTQAEEGDFGELYAAVCVFCRQGRRDLVSATLDTLDVEDGERVKAVTDALKDEMPAEWEASLLKGVVENYHGLVPIYAEMAGYRRSRSVLALLPLRKKLPDEDLAKLVWAVGRIDDVDTTAELPAYLDHTDQAVRSAAALALLRRGDEQTLKLCLDLARSSSGLHLQLAVAGGRAAVGVVLALAANGSATTECLLALGVLGDLRAVKPLYTHLSNEDVAEAAATGLNLITGADLYEDAFIPEEIDEDELFEEELEKYRQGEVPMRPDGQPFGTTVTRISQNPEDWHTWLNDNKKRFDARYRYRRGKPFSLAGLLASLESEHTPRRARRLAYEELVVRYQMNLPFEADMPVHRQKRSLADIRQWVQSNDQVFHSGAWYFAGRLLP